MMTPETMVDEIARWFRTCRRARRMTVADLASRAGCNEELVRRIEKADFEACFALREHYGQRDSVERKLCDAVGLGPALCAALDAGAIF